MSDSVIFHVDVNSAFLSWEACHRLSIDPNTVDLRDIPSIIGGDQAKRHGIVLAKSTLAKKCGIYTSETIHSALRKCPDLTMCPPNHKLYQQYSNQLINLLSNYAPKVEQCSVDEAFCDMSHTSLIYGDPVAAAYKLKDRIKNELGFTVNIGISTNKLLAKMASDFEKPDKVHTLFPSEISQKMWPMPVRELFFVGKSTEKKLHQLGIYTIGQLAVTDKGILRSHLKKQGELIYNYANGIDDGFIEHDSQGAKGYSNSTTIPYDVKDPVTAKNILLSLCESVCTRMRDANVLGVVIAVTITDHNFVNTTHQRTLLSPTNTTNIMYQVVCQLFDELWEGTPIRLLGCGANKITNSDAHQLSLFDSEQEDKLKQLDQALDHIRHKFGDKSIVRASFLDTDKNEFNKY